MAKKDNKSGSSNPASTGGVLPLFYSNPVPLDAKRHATLGLKKNFGFSYASKINAVPINMIEMPQVCHYYPIAFSPDASAMPVAILGLRDNENLFVNEKGEWEEGTYIPSYIRRYPFIFSEAPGSEKLTLCIDENDKVTEQNSEQAFFDKTGKPSALSNNALEFCKNYHGATKKTAEFSRAMANSGLLIEKAAKIQVSGNRSLNFKGFSIVDEEKLAQFGDKDFLDMRAKGWLPFVYAHLFSGGQWQRLTIQLNKRLKKEAA